jgi:hypothetical protein
VAESPTGLVEATAQQYHGDELADRPTLSKSIIQILLQASPAHARHAHPKLNPNFERKEETKFDLGNAVHQVFLEGIDAVAVIPFDSWRTAAAKEEREAARASGRIPMLPQDYERVEEMVVALRSQLEVSDEVLFHRTNGHPEQTILWDEDGVACRARLDWLLDDCTEIHDLKTTGKSAKPEAWCRSILFAIGADVQAAFYSRGVQAVTGVLPRFRFVVVENEQPFAVSVIDLDDEVLQVGNAKVDRALEMWRDCVATDIWPAYGTYTAPLPPWQRRWIEDALEEEAWATL